MASLYAARYMAPRKPIGTSSPRRIGAVETLQTSPTQTATRNPLVRKTMNVMKLITNQCFGNDVSGGFGQSAFLDRFSVPPAPTMQGRNRSACASGCSSSSSRQTRGSSSNPSSNSSFTSAMILASAPEHDFFRRRPAVKADVRAILGDVITRALFDNTQQAVSLHDEMQYLVDVNDEVLYRSVNNPTNTSGMRFQAITTMSVGLSGVAQEIEELNKAIAGLSMGDVMLPQPVRRKETCTEKARFLTINGDLNVLASLQGRNTFVLMAL
ncbi:hypothetical protein P153DRAFT_361752 [Dothidotthia symphoricarpi CBS 119687]|uniref:Uncharacterized protein n=1 Tax=Dothidotthia symphoricarpi CBS 119687 TaxID=1392245 RepID=A0A6A5ZY18_9PLEO|nr:uncharacterized protein P153DRAFT_361752 [Dothidotthia symphoricarpi CBS 119687]KAF2123773.1 hypothetical protein P153DRAFT_361752 [Dothidotthia symphoricarpi CBS 119687]